MRANELSTVCLLTRVEPGHHQAYADLFTKILENRGIGVHLTDRPSVALAHPGPLLVLMVEQFPLLTYVLATMRALRNRRTTGLLFRSKEALAGTSLRLRVKRALLRFVRRFKEVAILTIVPHSLLPGADRISSAWIDDPQLWDLHVLAPRTGPTPLGKRVLEAARDRPIILCVGLLGPEKGLDAIVALAADAGFTDEYLLVLAGPIQDSVGIAEISSCDCVIQNRYLEETELLSLYEMASFVWAVYAPSYDQASGVFSRAAQMERVPIVRRGSLVDHYASHLGTARVSVDWPVEPDEFRRALSGVHLATKSPAEAGKRRVEANSAVVIKALFGGEVPIPRLS